MQQSDPRMLAAALQQKRQVMPNQEGTGWLDMLKQWISPGSTAGIINSIPEYRAYQENAIMNDLPVMPMQEWIADRERKQRASMPPKKGGAGVMNFDEKDMRMLRKKPDSMR